MADRFSDRIGVTKPPVLTLAQMPDSLRTALWNCFIDDLFEGGPSQWDPLLRSVYRQLRWGLDRLGTNTYVERERLKEWYGDYHRRWYEIYNFAEFIAGQLFSAIRGSQRNKIYDAMNHALQEEGAGYRFIKQKLVPITNEIELAEIARAAAHTDRLAAVSAHIQAAMEDLGKRPQPDYRDCIKESIHAVGSALKILTDKESGTLEGALKEFEKKHPIHPALRTGLSKLYGYTNDEKGLRHELLEPDAKVGFAEAKFFLVACSAFANYIIQRADASG